MSMRKRAKTGIDKLTTIINHVRLTAGIFMNKSAETLTITRLAEETGIPKRTLFEMIKDGRFPVEPIKGTQPRRWNKDQVIAWSQNR